MNGFGVSSPNLSWEAVITHRVSPLQLFCQKLGCPTLGEEDSVQTPYPRLFQERQGSLQEGVHMQGSQVPSMVPGETLQLHQVYGTCQILGPWHLLISDGHASPNAPENQNTCNSPDMPKVSIGTFKGQK